MRLNTKFLYLITVFCAGLAFTGCSDDEPNYKRTDPPTPTDPVTPVTPTIPIPATVRRGSRGETVTLLQQLLVSRGYVIGIDGDFGPETEKAVRDFQNKQHLGVDGVVGPKTWTALLK